MCPTGAIGRDAATDAVLISLERCIGCKMCMMVCPFGNIQSNGAKEPVVKCDLCGGEPSVSFSVRPKPFSICLLTSSLSLERSGSLRNSVDP